MTYMIRKAIRQACQSGLLGFNYPSDFSIRTCLRWSIHRHERTTINYLRASLNPRDVFINVGAHVGYYAAYAGRLVGRKGGVFAFEPHPRNFNLLVHNCRNMQQVKTIQAAVSDSSGEALLFEHSTSSSSHALTDLSGSEKSILVRRVILDEWLHENGVGRTDVVLIDVEGHELSVLRGMRHAIENNPHIVIIMEYCPSNWTSRDETIDSLIKEIHKMKLNIRCALGQSQEYFIPIYTSEVVLEKRLAAILEQEIDAERHDYVNIVLRR